MLFLAQHRGYDAAKSSVVLYLTQIFAIRAQTDFPQMMFHRLQEGGSVRPSVPVSDSSAVLLKGARSYSLTLLGPKMAEKSMVTAVTRIERDGRLYTTETH